MATLNDHLIAYQTVINLARMVPEMADLAAYYKANPKAKDNAALSSEIAGNANQHLIRLLQMEALKESDPAAYDGAIQVMQLDSKEIDNTITILKTAAQQLSSDVVKDQTKINASVDAFVAAIPEYKRIF